jgi:hypothetical protein
VTEGHDPRKPRGRPKAEPHSAVTVWLSTADHDALIEHAKARDQSLSKTVRDILAAKLTGD